MTTVNGLPSHVLFVHFIVVLAPLTALLAILCAVWPAARRRVVWLVLGLAVVNAALTPITTHAGEWLENRVGRSPRLHTHTELGDTMLYFSIALLVAAILLALLRVRASRSGSVNTVAAGCHRGCGHRRERRHDGAGLPHRRLGGAGGVGRHRSRDHTLTRSAATPLTVGARRSHRRAGRR